MDKKIAVYLCGGCGIAGAVDLDALERLARGELKVPLCRRHDLLCGPEGGEILRRDAAEGVNSFVIAACSPREKTDAFSCDPAAGILTRVSLREGVAWCQEAGQEDTQALAEDYLRMGIARARKAEPLPERPSEVSRTVLVVGGGVTGLAAARVASGLGCDVVLVEREAELGGWMAKWRRQLPTAAPWAEAEPPAAGDRIGAVRGDPRITVHLSTTVTGISGQPGEFAVTLGGPGGTREISAGAVIQATGWRPYDARKLGSLGYGAHPNVVTGVEFEALARAGRIVRPDTGAPPRTVAFVLCAGSRDEEHLAYCSSVCCRAALKQAGYVRADVPGARVYILYRDIRAPGLHEEFYRKVQDDPSVFFMKGLVSGIAPAENGELEISLTNTLLGGDLRLAADLVVLATGMVPNAADGEAIRRLRDAKAMLARAADGKESGPPVEEAHRTVEALGGLEGTEILHLSYRQGPDLPALGEGFPDSHFLCFPYETRRTGIYAAGALREPMDAVGAAEDAAGAALKAVQCLTLASRGAAVHPRAGDLSVPDFFLARCTQCKRCTEECPFGSLDEDEKGTPKPHPARCRRCGICLGSCPERIINFPDYSVDLVGSMIKAVEVPDADEEKPRLLGLVCENDALPALDLAAARRLRWSPFIRFIPVRCLGSVNVVWIADALAHGYDGVLLLGCKSGADYQCHFIKGSELAECRGKNIQEKLEQMALENERVRLETVALDDAARLPSIIDGFAARIGEIGPNPFKC